jgi:uncharacterized membrane protein
MPGEIATDARDSRVDAIIQRLTSGAVPLLLVVIVAAGTWLRADGLRWDGMRLLHPGERSCVARVADVEIPPAGGDPLSSCRPLAARMALLAGARPATDTPAQVAFAGRLAGAGADTLVIVLVFGLALALFSDRRVAIAASALYAACVLPIQHAHFFTPDSFVSLFSTAALTGLVFAARSGRWGWWLWVGVATGLALATSLVAAPLLAVMLVVGAVRIWPGVVGGEPRGRVLRQEAVPLFAGLAVAAVTLRVFAPDMFVEGSLARVSPRWIDEVRLARQFLLGLVDAPATYHWAGRTPLWDPWRDMVIWGMGWPLGLTAWIAAPVAFWQLRRRRATLAVPLAWIALVFTQQGTQFVQDPRHLLPICPVLAVLAAWGLVALGERARSRSAWQPVVTWFPLAVVLVTTWSWALAFTSVYRRPNTRVVASTWLYAHAPSGSVLAVEPGDEALPLAPDGGRDQGRFVRVVLDLHEPDTPGKLDRLVAALDRVDYVVLSSDRFAGSLPRMAMRYPMTTRYYEALESGTLGLDRVAEFTARPTLGPVSVDDSAATATVAGYDHPHVRIFRKGPEWSGARARSAIGAIDWDGIVEVAARDVGRLPNLLQVPDALRDAQRQAGTWSADLAPGLGLFTEHGFAARHPVLVWVVVVELLGWCAWPLAAIALRRSPDRGWLFSRAIGLLIVSFIVWLGASAGVLQFTFGGLLVAIAAMTLASLVAMRTYAFELWSCWRRSWAWFGVETALFWTAFAVMLWIRARNPGLGPPSTSGDTAIDLGVLNALVRTESFPAFDPWFAGGTLNARYFGLAMVAALVKLTGVVPATAYALAIATFFAMTAGGVFATSQALARALCPGERDTRTRLRATLAGLLAIVGVVLLGALVSRPAPAPPGQDVPRFLFDGLGAPPLGIPLLLLVLALAVDIVARGRRSGSALLLGALVLGALFATSPWDQPVGVALVASALLVAFTTTSPSTWARGTWEATWRTALVLVVGRVLFRPFHSWFGQGRGGLDPLQWPATRLLDYLAIHGVFLAVLAPGLLWCAWRWRGSWTPGRRLVVLLAGLALVLTLVPATAADAVGQASRVRGLAVQAWVVWAACAAVVLAELLMPAAVPVSRASAALRGLALVAGTLAWAGGFVYASTAPRQGVPSDGGPSNTIDGEAYLETAHIEETRQRFALRDDAELIRWMRGHIEGTPVVVEAQTPDGRWGGRISAHTGLPTVLGWGGHARRQREALTEAPVARRERDVQAIYETLDPEEARALLQRYRVEYIVVGALERALYRPEGLAKFAAEEGKAWRRVYEARGTALYFLPIGLPVMPSIAESAAPDAAMMSRSSPPR